MNNEPNAQGDQVSDLVGKLEGSLSTPDPLAIHAGLDRRRAAARSRRLTAGAFVVVLVIAGAALSLSQNKGAETINVADASDPEFSSGTTPIPTLPPSTVTVAEDPVPTSTTTPAVPTTPTVAPLEEVATTAPLEEVATTLPAPDPVKDSGPDNAVLATEGEFDGQPGVEQIWLDADGTLHAGDLVGTADYWEVSDYWLDEQAELSLVALDSRTPAILLALPVNEVEDPSNFYQVFVADGDGLKRVFNQGLGVYSVTPLEFPGDGTASYVEDDYVACERAGYPAAIVTRQRVSLAPGGDGLLVEQSREDDLPTLQECDMLAG